MGNKFLIMGSDRDKLYFQRSDQGISLLSIPVYTFTKEDIDAVASFIVDHVNIAVEVRDNTSYYPDGYDGKKLSNLELLHFANLNLYRSLGYLLSVGEYGPVERVVPVEVIVEDTCVGLVTEEGYYVERLGSSVRITGFTSPCYDFYPEDIDAIKCYLGGATDVTECYNDADDKLYAHQLKQLVVLSKEWDLSVMNQSGVKVSLTCD
jgi:hypothetical protein